MNLTPPGDGGGQPHAREAFGRSSCGLTPRRPRTHRGRAIPARIAG